MQLKYTVKVWREGKWFPETIRNVIGDSTVTDANGLFFFKCLTLEDGTLYHIKYTNIDTIKYSKEREAVIQQNMVNETGQNIPLRK